MCSAQKSQYQKLSLGVVLFLTHAYFWKMAVYEMTKALTYLMKLVNLDTTR
jgi:hypothetical protein